MWNIYKEKLTLLGFVVVPVKAITGRPKTEAVEVMSDGVIKISVNEAPDKGRANDALCFYLSKVFQVPVNHVKLLTGQTGRKKQFKITL